MIINHLLFAATWNFDKALDKGHRRDNRLDWNIIFQPSPHIDQALEIQAWVCESRQWWATH